MLTVQLDRLLGRLRLRQQDNILMDIRGIRWKDTDWTDLDQDRNQR
jgi:hypothetical protein